MMGLRGSTALVTGAAAGLGRAIAEELVTRGATVVCVDVDGARLAETVADLRGRGTVLAIKADLRWPAECARTIEEARHLAGAPQILVNNAGISLHQLPQEITTAATRDLFAVNFFAPVRLTVGVLPSMLERGSGSVINVASVAGHIPTPLEASYGASKAALWRWSHNVDMELRASGIRVSTLSPGPMDTEIWQKDGGGGSYNGKLYPPRMVARAAVRLVQAPRTQRTVPRRFALPGALYAMAGRPTRWALRRFSARHPQPAGHSMSSEQEVRPWLIPPASRC